MRKPQKIEVVVHYPTTFYGMTSFAKQVVYANPDLLYDRIKKMKLPKDEKDILLAMAKEKERVYSRSDLLFYQLAAFHKNNEEGSADVP